MSANEIDPLEGMVDGHWLDRQEFPPLEWAVPGIVPEGFGLLVAPPKAGKSWLAAAIGLSCQSGGVALDKIRVDRRPVLYLALEDGHRRLQSRFRRLLGDGNPIPAISVIVTAKTHQVIGMMEEFLVRHPGEKPLIILDTLGKVRPPKSPGADSYQVDYAIGSQLKSVIDVVRGASMLCVHHTRKATSDDFIDSVSGTQGIAGSADYVLVLNRRRHSDDAILSVTGRDVEEREYALRSEGGVGWRLDGDDLPSAARTAQTRRESARLGEKALEVLAFVNSRPKTTPADVAEEFDIDNKSAGQYLARFAKDGRIDKGVRGVYHPTGEESEETAGRATVSFLHPHEASEENPLGEENETAAEQDILQFPHILQCSVCSAELLPDNDSNLCALCTSMSDVPDEIFESVLAQAREQDDMSGENIARLCTIAHDGNLA